MTKFLYKTVSIVVSVLGGMLAGAIFKQVWKLAADEDEAPKATDVRRGWREVLWPPPSRGRSSDSSRPRLTAARRRVPGS